MSDQITFTQQSLAAALDNVRCLSDLGPELIAEQVFAALAQQPAQAVPAVRALQDSDSVPDDFRNQASGYRAGWNDCLATAAPAAQEPLAWISVADRLPKPGVTVLACYTNSHGKVRRICAEYVAPKSRQADYPCDTDEECVEYDEAADQHYWAPGWYECVDNWSDYTSLAVTEGEILHWAPLPAAPGEEQPYSTTSDKYRAELYDEVWEKARAMGHSNVTEALAELERMKAADRAAAPANTVKALGDLATAVEQITHDARVPNDLSQQAASALIAVRALLAGGEA